MMRILIVTPAYEPAWAFGGVVRSISNLCKAMAQLGAKVSVYTTNADGEGNVLSVVPERPTDIDGVSVTYFPAIFGKGSVWASRAMSHRLKSTISNFDIVYVAAVWQWIGISAAKLARKHKIPCVIGTHGSFHPKALEHSRLKKHAYWLLFLRSCVMASDAVHFTTVYERQVSSDFLMNKTSFIVPNLLSDEWFAPEAIEHDGLREKFDISNKDFLLLTVARPDPVKRLDILLKAFKEVRNKRSRMRLLIVGSFENEYGNRMKHLAEELEISKYIVWAGHQSGDNLRACYKASDTFVLTSAHENFSMVAMEAMSSGIPVVISKNVGIAKDVEDNDAGIVVENTSHHIAEAVSLFESNSDRVLEAGQNASQMAKKLYDSRRVASVMLKAFDNVISGSKKTTYLPSSRGSFKEKLIRLKYSAIYDIWKRVIQKYSKLGQRRKPLHILDVGCGAGNFICCLEKWFPDADITGLDISPELLQFCEQRTKKTRLIRGSAETLDFNKDTFHVITSFQVVEHLKDPDVFFEKAYNMLKDDGLLLIATPNPCGVAARLFGKKWQGFRDDHVSLRPPDHWHEALKKNKFDILDEGTTLFNGIPLIGRIPFGIFFQFFQFIFGWFPWVLGESYMVVASKKPEIGAE